MSEKIRSHRDLHVFMQSYNLAREIFILTKVFPKEETYSLTDQIRRSSRSVAVNIAEAFRKRRYPKHFISKLSDCEAEAAETQVWLDFSLDFEYLSKDDHKRLSEEYEIVIARLVTMSSNPDKWKW
jgi:four helix bundle protein